MNIRFILIVFFFLVSTGIALCQKSDTSTFRRPFTPRASQEINSPDLEAQLIPLDSIIAIALRNSPYRKYDSIIVGMYETDIVLAKRKWQYNIAAFGNYSGGNTHFLTTGSALDAQNNLYNGYRYGLNVSLPLAEFTTRKLRINQERAKLQSYMHKMDQSALEIKKQVVSEYNNLIATQRLLKVKTVARENALVLQQMADKQFHEGTTSLEDYATVTNITNNTEADYEFTKSSFNTLYKQFEYLLGVPLTSIMKKK